ncbi:tail fiber protein [Brevibacillus ruminantium]|uniref:Tail fiber protein n=1 Tax=Brevibacillus ruminantium TaxID=2950604 RepID=A0ABY4WG11_9BACL|nr:tail fiber protein [Brevibacillus ruminantium]USG65063.1 tail fiber protein [Brevibacillus ruminantium]
MADAYLGEIRIFAGNFAPKGWALCDGQLLHIQQYTALYSIINTQYGGDGKTTFALPNLMGSATMHQGQGQGLTPRTVGSKVGSSTVTLTSTQIPAHTHIPQAVIGEGNSSDPTGRNWATPPQPDPFSDAPNLYDPTPNVQMSPVALNVTGGSQPHNNLQPFIAQNFIICLDGEYPSKG